jgi:hypothetical protein
MFDALAVKCHLVEYSMFSTQVSRFVVVVYSCGFGFLVNGVFVEMVGLE